MNLSTEFLGSADLYPREKVRCGSFGSWKLTYVVGKYGIDDTGEIMVVQRSISDWEPPQVDKPKASGYTTVETTGNASLAVEIQKRGNIRPWRNCLKIKVYDGYLKEGDKITVNLGDQSRGGPGIRVQSFCENRHVFKFLVDPFGTGRFEELPENPALTVIPASLAELQVVIPSMVEPGEESRVVVRGLDSFGNPSSDLKGEVFLKITDGDSESIKSVHLKSEDEGYKVITGVFFEKPGVYRVEAELSEKEITAISNRCICKENLPYRLFWGDMHGQTEITVGTGTLDEYFDFARGPAALDFSSWQGNDFQITDDDWEDVKRTIKDYNSPGNFITFLGYEWSGLTPGGGDHNIYFLGDDGPLHRSNQWLVEKGIIDDGSDRYPISELWKEFSGRDDVMAVPHVGGRYANFDFYNPEYIKLVEIHSHHGTFEWFAREALEKGLKVGFIAGSDDHSGRPGLSYPTQRGPEGFASFDVKSGYVAVYAGELTREGIWEALKDRRCYATTSQRIYLDFKVDGHIMGEEFTSDSFPEIKASVIGTSALQRVELLRGNTVIYRYPVIKEPTVKRKIRIVWSGVRVRTRAKKTVWNGSVFLDKGRIVAASEFAFDRKDEGVKLLSNQLVSWNSTTSGDMDGVLIELDAPEDAVISFQAEQTGFEISLKDVKMEPAVFAAGGVDQAVEVALVSEEGETGDQVDLTFIDEDIEQGSNPYWLRVIQEDGNMAWSSPVYVNYH